MSEIAIQFRHLGASRCYIICFKEFFGDWFLRTIVQVKNICFKIIVAGHLLKEYA